MVTLSCWASIPVWVPRPWFAYTAVPDANEKIISPACFALKVNVATTDRLMMPGYGCMAMAVAVPGDDDALPLSRNSE